MRLFILLANTFINASVQDVNTVELAIDQFY